MEIIWKSYGNHGVKMTTTTTTTTEKYRKNKRRIKEKSEKTSCTRTRFFLCMENKNGHETDF